jgi:ABC-type Na+ efflux pump permease subunit
VPEALPGLIDKVLFIFLNYTFIPYFMLVPIMTSSVIASDSIVGEKERKTLETLLYTPVTNKEFLTAKLFGAFIPAVIVSWAGFAGYFTLVNLFYYLYRETLIVRSWIWAPVMLFLSPAVSLLGLSITLLVSLKAKTYMEAQQMAGIVVLPFVVLIIVQITGLFILKPLYIIILGLILVAAGYLVTLRVAPRFSRESIINTL